MKLVIAEREIPSPHTVIATYVRCHARTVREYDGLAGTISAVDLSAIRASRVISSRISNAEGERLIALFASLEWGDIPPGASLKDADAAVAEGLYDAASRNYKSVLDQAGKGVSHAKVSKLFYLIRPSLFPVLDSRVRYLYRARASEAAKAVAAVREDYPFTRDYWQAIRADLLENSAAFDQLQSELENDSDPEVVSLTGNLTPLRLMDILTWTR